MKKIFYIALLGLVLVGFWAGFYYKDSFLGIYNKASQNIQNNVQNFKKSDLGNTIQSVAKQVLTSGPLNIGGTQNSVILTGAKVIAQTNFQRFDNGSLLPLIENTTLDVAAKAKAEDMFKNQYFEHISPSGVDPGKLVKSFGYEYVVSGENLILGNFKDEAELVQAWMNSPGHRANILNSRFVDIGVAVVKGTYKGEEVWIGVQEFGLPLSSCQSPDKAMKAEIDANLLQLNDLSEKISAKKAQIDSTDPHSSEYNRLIDQYNALVAEYNQLNQITKNIISQYNAQVNNFNNCVAGPQNDNH